jgi:hypothetical protein
MYKLNFTSKYFMHNCNCGSNVIWVLGINAFIAICCFVVVCCDDCTRELSAQR